METTVFATPLENGKWILTDKSGNEAQEGYEYDTKAQALEAATKLWPTNSVWQGRKVVNGWRIKID